jgi:threonine synthase
VRQSDGGFVLVEDAAILASILPLARLGAVFAEPAGATAFAGVQVALAAGLIRHDETVVVINTGSGLKDVPAAMQMTGEPLTIAPTLAAVQSALQTFHTR